MADEFPSLDDDGSLPFVASTAANDPTAGSIEDLGNTLRFASVKEITNLFRSSRMVTIFQKLAEYDGTSGGAKNAIVPEDPEYGFVSDCSDFCVRIELEKCRVHQFIRDHYSVRFPELAKLVSDGYTLARIVHIISNDINLTAVIEDLEPLLPSQIIAAVICCASATHGRELTDLELQAVFEACDEMIGLEEAKQTLLGYIQSRMPLIAPNLSAFVGTAIASQLFALAGSMENLARMDQADIAKLGAERDTTTAVVVHTQGFLINVDLVRCHPPELRAKAMRLVAQEVSTVCRVDAYRHASDNSVGLQTRENVKIRMLRWSDPLIIRGAAHDTYEGQARRKRGSASVAERQRRGTNKFFQRV